MSIRELFKRNRKVDEDEVIQEEITLDEQQKDIVYSDHSNILVVASAGSGKTRVLTERIKHLLEVKGVPAHNIIAITFTNLAAEEMKERLKHIDTIGDAFIGTIHSFANRIMQNYNIQYTILNGEIEIELIEILIKKYCSHLTLDDFLKYKDISDLVDRGELSESAKDCLPCSKQTELQKLYRSIEETNRQNSGEVEVDIPESIYTLCKERNILTFDELLIKAKEYFVSINARVEHLFIDEFQDVGHLENNFINNLNASNLFLVGDDFQSIYSFKGSDVGIFLSHYENPETKVFYLTNNYRNCKEILSTAEVVINQVQNKIEKVVNPINETIGEVIVKSKDNLEDLLDNLDMDDYKDWFILTRTNQELFNVANLCKATGIPYVTFRRDGLSLSDLRKNLKSNKVKILTVHTSKGLEADNVILYGKFPIVCPSYLIKEEERKVMYVGITRARNKLIILN